MAILTLSPILLEQTFLSIPTSITLLHLTLQLKSPKLTLSGRQPGSLLHGQTWTCVHPLPCKIIFSKSQLKTLASYSSSSPVDQISPRLHTPTTLWTLVNLCDIDSSSYASHSFSINTATNAGATGILNWLVKFWVAGNLTHTKLTSGLPRKQYVRFLSHQPLAPPANNPRGTLTTLEYLIETCIFLTISNDL